MTLVPRKELNVRFTMEHTTNKLGQKWLKNIFVFNIDVSILKGICVQNKRNYRKCSLLKKDRKTKISTLVTQIKV